MHVPRKRKEYQACASSPQRLVSRIKTAQLKVFSTTLEELGLWSRDKRVLYTHATLPPAAANALPPLSLTPQTAASVPQSAVA